MNFLKFSLKAAAIYNLLFAIYVIALPDHYFLWAEMSAPNYPQLWQCIGMIVGVYGLGYWIAARDPLRHWPIILVGFLGKIFGPIGFLQGLWMGDLPWKFGTILLTNDLLWWPSFGLLLFKAWKHHGSPVTMGR